MARTVLILGFEGVQALDMVGPFEVFTGASMYASRARPATATTCASSRSHGAPVSTGTGLTLVADPLPDPAVPVDTVVLPGGFGTETARKDPDLIDWIAAVGPARPPRGQRVHRRGPGRAGRPARRLRRHHTLGVRAAAGIGLPRGHRRPGPDLRPQLGEGVDRRGRHRGHRPGAGARRRRPRYRRRPDRRALSGDVPAPAGRADAVRRAGVDAARPAHADPRRTGGHRGRTRRRAQRGRAGPARRDESPAFHPGVHRGGRSRRPGAYVERIRTEAARRQLTETDDPVTVVAARCGFGSSETHASPLRPPARRLAGQYRKTFA